MVKSERPQTPEITSALQRAEQALLDGLNHELSSGSQLHSALRDHFNAGGGRVRMALALDASHRLGLSAHNAHQLAVATELLHNASLIHDDLQDQDLTRRGQPAIWAAYGSDVAILAGDYLLASAFGQIGQCTCEVPALIQHLHKRTSDLIYGQALDLAANEAAEQFSLQRYREIVAAKSGALLALPLELALIASHHAQSLPVAQTTGQAFAIAYQISDDLNDIQSDARHNCLNLVHALLSGGDEYALHVAITEGSLQCQYAIDMANHLPHQCGDLMMQQAQRLLIRFKQMRETHNP